MGTILSVKPSVKSFSGSANSKGESDGDGILKILLHKADGSKDIVNIDTASDAANDKRRIKLNYGYALTGYKLQGETVDHMHLESIVYQRLDSDVEKIRRQFKINSYEMRNETRINSAGEEYTVKVKKEIPNWLIGLTLAVSRRANNSFAIDYKSDGVLNGNQLIIKQYLEARSRVFECHSKLREWKNDIESLGNITRLHRNIELAAKAFNISLELNIKDLKIDPYGMIFADNKNISVQDIFKEAAKDQVNYDATRAKLRFNDLSSEQRNSIIASCLPAASWEELNQCYSTLQLAKEVMKDHALLICSSYYISNNGTASMGERIIQLNLNYETIQKHAGIAPYKYYLKNISTIVV